MKDLNIIRAWNGVSLPPEADQRIRRELETAAAEKERRHTRSSRLRAANRRVTRIAAATVLAGTLLTVAAVAAAAVRLPGMIAGQRSTALQAVSNTMPPVPMLRPADIQQEDIPPEQRVPASALPRPTESPVPAQTPDLSETGPAAALTETPEPGTTPEQEQTKGRWEEADGKFYYYDAEGKKLSRWQQIDGDWYYFDMFEGCAMKTGWLTYGRTHYLDPDGRMATGWRQIDGRWYYFWEDGSQAGGWQRIGGEWYYFDEHSNAPMVIGWVDGSSRSGTYYTDANGRMVTGQQYIFGKWYDFGEDGRLIAEMGPNGLWYRGPEIVGWDPPNMTPYPIRPETPPSDQTQPDPEAADGQTGTEPPAEPPEPVPEDDPAAAAEEPGVDSIPDEEDPEQ